MFEKTWLSGVVSHSHPARAGCPSKLD